MDVNKDKYYTDNGNDRPYWIGEQYYGKKNNINKDKKEDKYYTDNGNDRPYWIGEEYYKNKN